jgi:hypothetical protein
MTTPESTANGKFTLYLHPDGGYHIAYKFDHEDDTRHIDIPAALVRMAQKASGGQVSLGSVLKMKGAAR